MTRGRAEATATGLRRTHGAEQKSQKYRDGVSETTPPTRRKKSFPAGARARKTVGEPNYSQYLVYLRMDKRYPSGPAIQNGYPAVSNQTNIGLNKMAKMRREVKRERKVQMYQDAMLRNDMMKSCHCQ